MDRPLETKIEDTILEFVGDLHPTNIRTGDNYTPSLNEFNNAVWNAVTKLVNLFDAECKNCPLFTDPDKKS